MTHLRLIAGAGMFLISALLTLAQSADGDEPGRISFATQVRPIFNRHCIACHGGIKQAGGLSFVYRETIVGDDPAGDKVVIAGNAAESELIARVTAEDDEERMPPADHGERLSLDEIEILRQWINEGAAWETHWAF